MFSKSPSSSIYMESDLIEVQNVKNVLWSCLTMTKYKNKAELRRYQYCYFHCGSLIVLFFCTLNYVHSSFAIILMGKREHLALFSLSSWYLVIVAWLFFAMPWVCLQFVIVVFSDRSHFFFVDIQATILANTWLRDLLDPLIIANNCVILLTLWHRFFNVTSRSSDVLYQRLTVTCIATPLKKQSQVTCFILILRSTIYVITGLKGLCYPLRTKCLITH